MYLHSPLLVVSQQQLVSNQNFWLLSAENIAAMPKDVALNIQGLYRRNWLGFDHAPELIFCRLETSNSKHGWDLKVQQYSNSIYRRQELKTGWRYSLKLDDNQNLNFGIRLGLLRSTYAWSNLHAQNPEELPELLMQSNWISPVADCGVLYSYKDFRLSLNATNLNLAEGYESNSSIRELPSFSLLTSYKFKVSKLSISPVMQVRSLLGLPLTYNLSLLLEKDDKYGLQCGYKQQSSLYASVRFFISNRFAFSYSYDFPIATQKLTGPGNELALLYFTKH
jgi:type IX secretion system PorP/SprF family membrane protein